MAIDYILEVPCEPRRHFGLDGLLDRLRLVHGPAPDTGRADDPAPAREALFDLRPLAFHCARCPANHRGREFGCYGSLPASVSREAEEWMVQLLPAGEKETRSPESSARMERVRALAQKLRDLGITGDAADERRLSRRPGAEGRSGLVLERSRCAQRRFGPLLRRLKITSSQLIHLLFLHGHVEPGTAELVCRALGVWLDGGTGEDGMPEVIFTQPAEEGDDPAVAAIKGFFLALVVACSLDVGVATRIARDAGGLDGTVDDGRS